MKKYILIFLISFTLNLFAQQNFTCIEDDSPPSQYFPQIQQKARQFNTLICTAIKDSSSKLLLFPQDSLDAFARFVKSRVSSKFSDIEIGYLQAQLNYFKRAVHTGKKFPVLNIFPSMNPGEPALIYFTGRQDSALQISRRADSLCIIKSGKPCADILQDLKTAINPYQLNKNAYSAFKTRLQLTDLQKEWNDYFENSKSQTFADIILTTLIERSLVKKDFLSGPPPRQWFILHPGIAYEYIKAAPDGAEINETFYVEWLGINWLKSWLFDLPLGLSASSFYSDVPTVNNSGHGLTLTLFNSYMLGYAYHDGEHGLVISVDLLKAFNNKGQAIGLFDDRLKDLFSE